MEQKRLFFIDAMRAWAILMMLQGHFIDGLLDPVFRNASDPIFKTWLYFRGITAPVFFTASGLIFTYLLFKNPQQAYRKERLKKGLSRVGQLLLLGYALRVNIRGLLQGHLYPSFFYADVLHCIGLSLLTIMILYVLIGRRSSLVFSLSCLLVTVFVFALEPAYDKLPWAGVPVFISNYFTKAHGSIFSLIPWLGYSTFGAFLALALLRFKALKHFYIGAIVMSLLLGWFLKYQSSALLIGLDQQFGWPVLKAAAYNNYLFIRLGDVLWVLALFMSAREFLKHPKILAVGQNTLNIYVFHSVILYGSFHGFGLYRYFKKSLSPIEAFGGALLFMGLSVGLSFLYVRVQPWRKQLISLIFVKKIQS